MNKSNWRTTLAGLAGGALNLFANGMNWKQILVSVGFAALGTLAHDSNNPTPPTNIIKT